ncbi:MAG: hypothetical protein Q8N18_12215 [Opitutaceae bacterium]|nr:hypothetical protein [Opitutaceae bacterium]
MMRFITIALVVCFVSGCASTWDRADKYREYVGKEFVARYDFEVWKMNSNESHLVSHAFKPVGTKAPSIGSKVALIPAGTPVKVIAAKLRYSGGDWDFLLCEVKIPGTTKSVIFENMIGFSSVDPREVAKWLAPAR